MTAVEFTVPGQPVMLLSANHRLHWRRKAERTKYWRQLANVVGQTHRPWGQTPPTGRTRVVVTFSWPDKRRRDVGNLAPTCKALVDGCVDAGLLADDDDAHILGPDIRRGHGPFAVTIRLEPIVGGEAA